MVDSTMTWSWGRCGRCLGVVTRRRACWWHVRGVGTAIQAPIRAVIHGHRLVESTIYTARAISTIAVATRKTATTHRRTRNIAASSRSGSSGRIRLEDVDREVDDDPHHVDEV